jgi:hypothetical protein
MKLRQTIYLFATAALAICLTSCGGSGSGSTPPPPPATISVALSPQPPASLAVSATTSLIAVVSNDTKNGGVNWSVTCASSSCGSFSPTATATGAATTYTAPTAVPTSNTVTVTATSVTDTTKSASATITITATVVLGNGTYVYHFSGADAAGPYFVVGAFTVQGGAITAGEQDFGDDNNESNDKLIPSGCSLTSAGENIQIVLDTGDGSIGVGGVETLRGAPVSSSRVLISEFDTFAAATGSIDLQTSAGAPSGGYAFAVQGVDRTASAYELVIGGILNVSGSALSTANSIYDYNDGGTVGRAQTFSSGSVSAPDSFGRITFNLTPAAGLSEFILTGYIIGANQIQLVESQMDTLSADLGGVALGQGTNTNSFNLASIANKTYVYGSPGEDVNGPVTIAGGFAFGSSGAVTGQLALNDGVNFLNTTINGGTYTVDPTGRVTLSGVSVSPAIPSLGPFTFQLYLDGNGNAIELGVDSTQATQGLSYAQTATSSDFEGSYAISGQGYVHSSGGASVWGAVGPVTVKSDALTGSTDYTIQGVTPTSSVSLTGTENSAVSPSLLSLTGLDGTSITTANTYSYFPIDSTRVLAIEIDGNTLGLLKLEGVSP